MDAALIICASLIAEAFYQISVSGYVGEIDVALGIGVTDSLIFVFLVRSLGLYRLPVLLAPARHLARAVTASIIVLLSLTAILFLLKVGSAFSRGSMLIFALVEIPLLVTNRFVAERLVKSLITSGAISGRRAVLIGEAGELGRLGSAHLLHYFGLKEVGRVTVAASSDRHMLQEKDLADIEHAINIARERKAEELVLAMCWGSTSLLENVSDRLRISPLPVRLLPDHVIRSVLGRRTASAAVSPTLSVELQRAPLTRFERLSKRLLDILVSALAILALSPLLVLVAVAIKIDSPGPVIFRQRRNGFNQLPFVIFKFRSMSVLEDGPVVTQAQRDDPRVTRVGRLLRRSSIDELPQLFNVLFGDMSLVGPRPHAMAHDDTYGAMIAKYAFRHHVKPGITGWAQVNGLRGETSRVEQMKKRVDYDLWYINNWSFRLDLQILLRTCFEVVRDRAY
jgi:undecaprenyl-phosphate galactose phosphotransferase/putative colanic acid biosynthesis UDP-glucose lipid carrier transferase